MPPAQDVMPPDEAKDTRVIFRSAAERVPPRTIRDITRLLDQYAPDPQRIAALQTRLNQSIPDSADRFTQAMAYWDRAKAAQELGAVSRQIADLRNTQARGSAEDPERVLNELSAAEWSGGNYLNAIRGFEQLRHSTIGYQITMAAILAKNYAALGDMEKAREMLASSKTSLSSPGSNTGIYLTNWQTVFDFSQGLVFATEGHLLLAENAFHKALRGNEEAKKTAHALAGRRVSYPSVESIEARGDSIESSLAINLFHQGRLGEAELAARNILQRTLKRNGKYSLNTGMAVSTLSQILYEGGRYREAEVLASTAISIQVQAGVLAESLSLAQARRARGAILVSLSRYAEAASEYEQARKGVAGSVKVGDEAPWAIALIRTGRAENAVALLEPMIEQSRQQLGGGHYLTAELRGYLAMARARLGQQEEALNDFVEATKVLLTRRRTDVDDESGSPARVQRRTWVVDSYIGLLADLHATGNERLATFDVVAEALRLADEARGGSVQRAVAASATRAALKDGRLAEHVRREQDLKAQIAALYSVLSDLLSVASDQQSPAGIAELRNRIAKLGAERKTLLEDIEHRFPDYANLINPRPADIEETRAALTEGEALLSILVTEDRSFVWALKKTGPVAFAAVPLGEREIDTIVGRLRLAVDPGEKALVEVPQFDLAAAYRLYASLLLPVEGGWRGARALLVSANGSLGQLPLATLPTRPVQAPADSHLLFAEYRDVPWLARQVAVVQLPSVNSLVRLRALPPGNPARRAFIGFGDPQFDRSGAMQLAAASRGTGSHLRNLSIGRVSQTAAVASVTSPIETAVEDWMDYSQIPPLPDTREEILAIAKALGADATKDVFLGTEASKKNVFSQRLDQRRIIAFSTHGLIPGDFPGLREPALALAAPDNPNETGLLALDEILQLKLDADWVVLSACNTGAGDGSGAEAVSGLGRGFFYAGSRSLLVTHWPVETISARLLVTGIFERYVSQDGITRAESLRQSMLKLMEGQYVDPNTHKVVFAYAHPIFWAPYALVGDGGGALVK